MATKADIIKELGALAKDVTEIYALLPDSNKINEFSRKYQAWYTKALSAVSFLAPDRLAEFKQYYEPEPKRGMLSAANYSIQDYVKGFAPPTDLITGKPDWDFVALLSFRIQSQLHILESLSARIDHVLANIESMLIASFQDDELQAAAELKKVSLRAAGAIAGVILEAHLQRTAKAHGIRITKANPTISELNDPLKNAGLYDIPAWRRIQLLGDIRNLCSHKKTREPTTAEIDDLLAGVNWAIKSIT